MPGGSYTLQLLKENELSGYVFTIVNLDVKHSNVQRLDNVVKMFIWCTVG